MDQESLDDLQKQLLTCPVCLDDFHDDTSTKVLPCLHLLCEACIPKIAKDGVLPCPTCRMEHQFDSFPTDNTTRDLSDYVVVKTSPTVSCEGKGCEETNVASHRCRPCGEFLCLDCVAAHRRTTVTRSHDLIPLEELRDATDFTAFCHPQTCKVHPGKPLELYCSKQECQKPICVTCAVIYHQYQEGHGLVDIITVGNQRRDEIKQMVCSVKEKSNIISKVLNEINDERDEIDLRKKQIYNQIDGVIEILHQQIDRTKEALKETVNKQVSQKCHSLEEQELKLKSLKSNIDHAVLYSDKVVSHSNVPAFLQLDKTISDRLQNLTVEQFDKEPWEMAAFGLDCSEVSTDIQTTLNQKMHIWSSSIFPPNTSIQQRRAAVPGEEVVFDIELFTSEKTPAAEEAHFQAMITDPRGDTLPGKVKDGGLQNGKFAIKYVPMVEGAYKLELTLQNKTFASRPFTVGEGDTSFLEEVSGDSTDPKAACEDGTDLKEIPEAEVPKLPQQMVTNNPEIFSTIRQIRFFLDKQTAHKEVTVTEDGTTFTNNQQGVVPKSSVLHPNRHKKFKGARGTHVFTQPGRYFYEVILEMKVVAPLQLNNIAFEIGIARKSSIDNKKYIEGQPYAWSMIGAHHPACDAVCVHVVRDRKVLLHKVLVKNQVDEECRIVLGFLLNTDAGTWEIYNSEEGEKLCIVHNVNCEEPLFPVVSGYNSSQVQVTANFITGHQNAPEEE